MLSNKGHGTVTERKVGKTSEKKRKNMFMGPQKRKDPSNRSQSSPHLVTVSFQLTNERLGYDGAFNFEDEFSVHDSSLYFASSSNPKICQMCAK